MIRRLRRKFIAMTMLALFLVLGTLIAVVNILNYRDTVKGADEVLEILAGNDGRFPEMRDRPGPGGPEDGSFIPENPGQTDREGLPFSGDGGSQRDLNIFGRAGRLSEETPFETRFFTVRIKTDGEVTETDTGSIAAVNEEQAVSYAKTAVSGGKTKGFLDDYRYRIVENDGSLVIFLDWGRNLSGFRSFLWTSLVISGAGLMAVFVLICVFSGRIIRPISESYEKQKQFITDAGHEIKTPITIIKADAEVLEMDVGQSEWIDDIRLQTDRLASLTRSLIDLSKMEEAGTGLEMIEFPVSEVVAEAAASFQAPAVTQGKSFTCEIAPMLTIKGNEKGVRQLVSILLDNALKYSPEGGEIRLKLESAGKAVRLSVYNTTKTVMEKESLSRLFDRFYRTDASRNSGTGGYGIGLSIARAVVEAHKGKISAASPDGQSLTITAVFGG